MKNIYSYLWIAPLFILLQVLFLNNIQFVSYINPLVYLILIITLPQDTDRWFLIIYAFYLGILLDLFEGNMGLNSSALVFTAFIRPYVQRISIPKKSVEEKDNLTLRLLGIKTFTVFALSIILMHHLFFFIIENFRFSNLFNLSIQIISSSLVTYILILIMQLFSFRNRK